MKLFLKLKENWWKISVLLIYTALSGIAAARHEPWFDEAQAWLLARDSSPLDLLVRNMRYEGSPALWHLLLMVPAKLGLPYKSLNIFSGAASLTGVYLFMRYSPFPLLVKILFPFSFFAFYQYGVVARSYALISFLLFLAAIAYKNRIGKPTLYILPLCFLANTTLHGFLIAGGTVFVHFLDIARSWREMCRELRHKQVISLCMFGFTSILIVLQLNPPDDLISFAAFNYKLDEFFPRILTMLSDSMATNNSPTFSGSKLMLSAAHIISQAAIVLTLFWLILRKKLLNFIVPIIGLGLLFTIIYSNVWHQGTLFFTWVFVLWISYEHKGDSNRLTIPAKKLLTSALVVILSIQVYWSYNSFRYDYQNSYSGSRELAHYIKSNSLDSSKIYMTNFHSVSILPYFSENIFCNYNKRQSPSFWLWSSKNTIYTEPYLSLATYNPDYIVLGIKSYGKDSQNSDISNLPEISGYSVLKVFSGGLYWKESTYESDSFALYSKIKD